MRRLVIRTGRTDCILFTTPAFSCARRRSSSGWTGSLKDVVLSKPSHEAATGVTVVDQRLGRAAHGPMGEEESVESGGKGEYYGLWSQCKVLPHVWSG